jgi:hypothetical protein
VHGQHQLQVTDIMSAPKASCLPSTKANEAVKYVIGTVLDFNLVDDCPLWLALIHDAMDKSQVNIYNQWLWLTPDDILALQYCPNPSKQKIVPLSRGYHTHVTRFKAMYSELQLNPGCTDLDIFKITYDEYMAFSRRYMAGQVTSKLLSTAPNLNASSTDPDALFTKLIVESKEKVAPKGIIDKDIRGDDAITAKGIKEIPSIFSRLLVITITVLPSEGDTNGVLNIIGDAAQGNLECAENFRHPSLTKVLSSMMFAVDPPLSSFHHGHQAFSTVKLKACPHGEPGTNMNSRPSLNVRNMAACADSGKAIAPKGIKCHMSTASKSMDTGKPYLFSSGTRLNIQVFDDLDMHPREVPQAPVVTTQGCYRYSPSSIIVPHNVSSILCDPSSHSVIPIPSQEHGESFTECRLQNHTNFAGLIYVPYSGTSLQHQIVLHSSDPEMMDQDHVFSSMKGMLICGPKENGIFLQGTTTPLHSGALLCIDPSMATMIDGLYGTKVLISPALMGRDELSGSIFGRHFLLVTSPDSDGTVLPFDRGPAKLLTASVRSLKLLPFDHGPTSHLPILQAILEISFKMTILFRYSSYRNYLLRNMYINSLGNRPQADGE